MGRSEVDPIEAALSTALTEAAAAGRFDVVAQLARELEARRTKTDSSNVFVLAARSPSSKRG